MRRTQRADVPNTVDPLGQQSSDAGPLGDKFPKLPVHTVASEFVLVWDLEIIPDLACIARVNRLTAGDDEGARAALVPEVVTGNPRSSLRRL
jgi:hypothetical protein